MDHKPLGKSGLRVSVVGLGCNNFGRRCDAAQTHAIVTKALDLGITLFECATGKVPFAKGDLTYHHLHTSPPYAKDLNDQISDRMNHLIARCIQKLPEDRFQSAEEILEVLKE